MASSPSLPLVPLRWSPRLSSGQRGFACASSAWRACGGGCIARAACPAEHAHVFSTERRLPHPDRPSGVR
eukprot:12230848-Alexandrium_andersonii.AAC.1